MPQTDSAYLCVALLLAYIAELWFLRRRGSALLMAVLTGALLLQAVLGVLAQFETLNVLIGGPLSVGVLIYAHLKTPPARKDKTKA